MSFEAILNLLGLPFVTHAAILATAVLLRKTSQLYAYGEIPVHLRPINGEVKQSDVRAIIEYGMENSSDAIVLGSLLRNYIVVVPILRFCGLAPILLYALYFVIIWAEATGVEMTDWDTGLVAQILIILGPGLQFLYILLKLKSGMVDHLMLFHPKYRDRNPFAIVMDWAEVRG